MLNDELSDLAIFAAVADAHSFTRAAVKLGKSQSALSQSVRRLEERLKLPLLTYRMSSGLKAGACFCGLG
jgi:DNA-binding transcriptional LysR family regulator